ncbi:haloacid dehalogenase type II [Amycolatopsis sp. H20-H5]|uniref:haloacid dehalogenase type II n=1 Tax=Amycolatopsis sp. H20-H5 TaxID=3046309 RepID=UPI002DB712CA|nr:haloacid dehalogenase type II [Amycolatopsis sp. H20-H5]MEC3978264.1 haloacid dehalogenase type II [Amycolatopsis sp. H20-H5]
MTAPLIGSIEVLAFDIFGTTVDWRASIAEHVRAVAADRGAELDAGAFADAWRDHYLPSMALVRSGSLPWTSLDELHRRSLDELLDQFAVASSFDEAARRRLVRAWHDLRPWPEAGAGLERLRSGYVTVALSNGGFALLTRLVKKAGLRFDAILSAELARQYKPSPEPYQTAARLLDVQPERILMVASHNWDLAGARQAGLRTAFVERAGEKGPLRQADRPGGEAEIVAADFLDLATKLGC